MCNKHFKYLGNANSNKFSCVTAISTLLKQIKLTKPFNPQKFINDTLSPVIACHHQFDNVIS